MDIFAASDKLAYIKKIKNKLNDEEWQISRYEMYLLLSLYHKSNQSVFPTNLDVDYFPDSQINESFNTIPLEWIKELQINEDVMTLMHHLPINTGSHILKIWTYFIYHFYDRCIFNIDNVIQLHQLINTKVEKEKKFNVSIYFPKLIFLRGASEEMLGHVNQAIHEYLYIFKLSHFDYNNFIFGKGTQDVLYRIIQLSLKKWYLLKPTDFSFNDHLDPLPMDDQYDNWQFQHCNTILWHSLKIYFNNIINNPLFSSAQHILILKYTITLLIELGDLPNSFLISIFPNATSTANVLDNLCNIYLATITALNPFPLAPTKVLYLVDASTDQPESPTETLKYSTLVFANKRIHDFVNLYMYRVLNTTDISKIAFISILKECIKISFHSLKILRFIAVAYCTLGDYQSAINYIMTYTHIASHRFADQEDNNTIGLDGDDLLTDYTSVLVLASRLFLIEMDNKLDESIQMAKSASDLCSSGVLKSRALQLMGMAHLNNNDLEQSNKSLLSSLAMEPSNWLISYQIALCYMKLYDLINAIIYARKAVQLNKYHVPSWHILTILLTGHKDYEAALQVCNIGFTTCYQYYFPKHTKSEEQRNMMDFMNDYIKPNESSKQIMSKDSLEDIDQVAAQLINMKLTETMIVEVLSGPKAALKTCKQVLKYYKLWNSNDPNEALELDSSSDISVLPSLQKSTSKSSMHSAVSQSSIIPKPTFTHISDRDVMKNKKLKFVMETAISRARTVSRRAKNLKNLRGPNKQKQEKSKLKELTTSPNSSTPVVGTANTRQQHVLITIWSRIVKLLIKSGQITDARESVLELQNIDSLNVDVWIGEALVLMAENKHREAIDILERISIENQPMELLMALAQGYFHINALTMAEHGNNY